MGISLVTGACGFVGSHMVDLLVSKGIPVRATDLPGARRDYLNPKAEWAPANLADASTLGGLFKDVDRVFHIAALFDYSKTFAELYKVNVQGTENLFNEAKRQGAPLKRAVVWGAAAVFGDFGTCPVKEDAPPKPLNDYARTKWIQEVRAFELGKEHGVGVSVIRPASIYGPRQRYGLFVSFKMIALGQNPPFLVNTSSNRVSLVHVADICNAALFLSEKPESAGEVYNLADDWGYTLEDITCHIGAQVDWPFFRWPRIPFWLAKMSAKDLARKAAKKGKRPPVDLDMVDYLQHEAAQDNSKLKALGYKFLYPKPFDGLTENIEWYKKEGWLPR